MWFENLLSPPKEQLSQLPLFNIDLGQFKATLSDTKQLLEVHCHITSELVLENTSKLISNPFVLDFNQKSIYPLLRFSRKDSLDVSKRVLLNTEEICILYWRNPKKTGRMDLLVSGGERVEASEDASTMHLKRIHTSGIDSVSIGGLEGYLENGFEGVIAEILFFPKKLEAVDFEILQDELYQKWDKTFKYFQYRFSKHDVGLYFLPQWSVQTPPIGIACLGAYMELHGYPSNLYDVNLEIFNVLPDDQKNIMTDHFQTVWGNEALFFEGTLPILKPYFDKWIEKICNSSEKYIGFSTIISNVSFVHYCIDEIKKRAPHKITIAGGPNLFSDKDCSEIMHNCKVDYAIKGEGEESLLDLVKCLDKHKGKIPEAELLKIPRVFYRNWRGVVKSTFSSKMTKNINHFPFPQLEDFKGYKSEGFVIPIQGSRGCIYRCTFCLETVNWQYRYRYKAGPLMAAELAYTLNVFKDYNSRKVVFSDSLINGSLKQLEEFSEEVVKKVSDGSLERFRWSGKASIRKGMTKEFLMKLSAAGCSMLEYGLESGSEKVREEMEKGASVELSYQVIKDTHESGIKVLLFLFIGYPTETDQDFEDGLNFLEKIKDYINIAAVGVTAVLQRGTPLWAKIDELGITQGEGGPMETHWICGTNTREVRLRRKEILIQKLEEWGVKWII